MKLDIDHDAFDAIPDLSRRFIDRQTNGAMLARWYDAIAEKKAELHEFVGARKLGGLDIEPIAGKLAFVAMAQRWVEARLIAIGHDVPYPPTHPLKREIANQAKRIKSLKQQVRDLGGDPDDTLSIVSGAMAA